LDETVDLSNLSFKVSETLQKYKSLACGCVKIDLAYHHAALPF
jgi:hypothetical protein